jgi:hypothetical protein
VEVTDTSIRLKWDQARNPQDLTRKSTAGHHRAHIYLFLACRFHPDILFV